MDQEKQATGKKHIMFDWFAQNGGLFEGFDVPVKFPGGEIGAAANRDLPQRTAIMSIPGKCIITVRKALESELKPIFSKHSQLFSDEHTSDLWSDVMALYLLFELLKKEKSFFHPFLEWLPKSDFTLVDWPMEKVKEFHSPLLEENTILLGEKLKKRYQTMKSEIIDKEELFLQFNASQQQLQEAFLLAYNWAITRFFSWSLPSSSIIPVADMPNYVNEWNASHYIVHKKYELDPTNKPEQYKVKKGRVDLSLMGIPAPESTPCKPSSKAKWISSFADFKKLTVDVPEGAQKQLQTIAKLEEEQVKEIKTLQELELYETSDEEDNDTDDEEEKKLSANSTSYLRSREKSKQVTQVEKPSIAEEMSRLKLTPDEGAQKNGTLKESSWDWLKEQDPDWYFTVATEGPLAKGQQIYINYGNRSNYYLLLVYGFALKENKYDSFTFRVKLDSAETCSSLKELSGTMVSTWRQEMLKKDSDKSTPLTLSEKFRLKQSRLCMEYIRFLRLFLLQHYPQYDQIHTWSSPASLDYEIFVMEFYAQMVEHALQAHADADKLPSSNHFETFIYCYRNLQKSILESQSSLAKETLTILRAAKNGSKVLGLAQALPLKTIHGVVQYLRELESSLHI